MELPFSSSIEVRAVKTLDCGGINGTTLPEDDPICGNHKRVPELFNGNLHLENVIGDKEYLAQTPEEHLQLEMECAPVDEELVEQPQQIAGESQNQ